MRRKVKLKLFLPLDFFKITRDSKTLLKIENLSSEILIKKSIANFSVF